ncbi:DUF1620-domain-containing protein [Atractiella rhizophila]|nr:DUF1620-domain-containing protein [Atractiella rhizophila]
MHLSYLLPTLLALATATPLHIPLLGLPSDSPTQSPSSSFVYPSYRTAKNTQNSYYITRTDQNILAALRPKNGEIIWRHAFDSLHERLVDHKVHHEFLYTISIPRAPAHSPKSSGSRLRKIDVFWGRVVWERSFPGLVEGLSVRETEKGEEVVVYNNAEPVIVVLGEGDDLRVDAKQKGCGVVGWDAEGRKRWGWECGSEGPSILLSAPTKEGFAVVTPSSLLRLSATGTLLSRHKLPHTLDYSMPYSILPMPSGPILVYIPDTYNVYTLALGGEKEPKAQLSQWKHKLMGERGLKDIGLGEDGYIMVSEQERGWVVARSNSDGALSQVWEFGKDEAVYTGFKELEKGTPHIIRISYSPVLGLANFQHLTPNPKSSPMMSGSTFPFKQSIYGKAIAATIELKPSASGALASRIMMYTDQGTMQLWQEGREMWTREEGMTKWGEGRVVLLEDPEEVVEKLEHDAAEIPLPFMSLAGNVSLAERTGKPIAVGSSLNGLVHALDMSEEAKGKVLWCLSLGAGVEIEKVERAEEGGRVEVFSRQRRWTIEAKTGRVILDLPRPPVKRYDVEPKTVDVIKTVVTSPIRTLGDGTHLVKYLNPHLQARLLGGALEIVDSSTGSLIDQYAVMATHALLAENWLIFTYEPSEVGGWTTIVSVEYYWDQKESGVMKIEQAFRWVGGVKTLGITSTRMGITTKNLLVATENGQIYNIPRKFLDPRRPVGKPSKDDQEEMLIPYDPVIPPEPRWIVSGPSQVLGVEGVVSAPSRLESTSFVLAYGADLFLDTVAPSQPFDILSDSFNKHQLVGTIAGLMLGVGITRPMVKKKQLRAKWYS